MSKNHPDIVTKSRYRVLSLDGFRPEVYDVVHVKEWNSKWKEYMFGRVSATTDNYRYSDNGNRIHIEGDGLSIDLNYSQVDAIFRLLSFADQHTAKHHYNGTGWTNAQVITTRLVRKKREKKNATK